MRSHILIIPRASSAHPGEACKRWNCSPDKGPAQDLGGRELQLRGLWMVRRPHHLMRSLSLHTQGASEEASGSPPVGMGAGKKGAPASCPWEGGSMLTRQDALGGGGAYSRREQEGAWPCGASFRLGGPTGAQPSLCFPLYRLSLPTRHPQTHFI